jgi:hypothetical protein
MAIRTPSIRAGAGGFRKKHEGQSYEDVIESLSDEINELKYALGIPRIDLEDIDNIALQELYLDWSEEYLKTMPETVIKLRDQIEMMDVLTKEHNDGTTS